jgi:hypothetical protein
VIKNLALCTLILAGMACDVTPNAEQRDRAAVARQQAQYGVSQPIPGFDFSLERDIVIQLYQARNERVATHTVWRSDTGIVEGDCPSTGYPVPYDTSLTNPLKIGWSSNQGGAAVIEQAEPNGIYASKNSIATWVRCVYKVQGKRVEAPIYVESKVTAFPFPVEVDYATGRVQPVADMEPTVTIKEQAPAPAPAPAE